MTAIRSLVTLSFVASLLMISSCSYHWTKANLDPAQFDRDHDECQRQSEVKSTWGGSEVDSSKYESCMTGRGYTLERRALLRTR